MQELAVGFALLPLTVDHPWLANTALWFAVALTLVTGIQYLVDGRAAATTLGYRKAAGPEPDPPLAAGG